MALSIAKPLRLDTLQQLLVVSRISDKYLPSQFIAIKPCTPTNSSPSPLSMIPGKIKELSILYAISEAFQDITDAEVIFHRLAQLAHEMVGAHSSTFTTLDHGSSRASAKTINVGDEE